MTFFNQLPQASSSVKKFAKYAALAAILTLSFSQISHAALIQGADENLTIDTGTGLIWLDVDFTTNVSWNQMQTMLLSGGTFENFQLTTTDQITKLFENGGLGTAPIAALNYFTGPLLTNLTNFLQLTGSTPVFATTELSAQRGYYELFEGELFGGGILDRKTGNNDILASETRFGGINLTDDLDLTSPYIGFYLVCKSKTESSCTYKAPEPSLLGLLIPSLIAIGYGARRRFNKD